MGALLCRYVPKRRMSTYTTITGAVPTDSTSSGIQSDESACQGGYQPESHRWSSEIPLPDLGTWYKVDS